MPRYFFHLWTKNRLERDTEGITFDTLEDATVDAEASLFEMASEDLARGSRPSVTGIDITDSLGTLMAEVKVNDAVN